MRSAESRGDTIREEKNDDGETIEYACEKLSNGNKLAIEEVPYYYDLTYPCQQIRVTGKQYVSSRLLEEAASRYRILPDAASCIDPNVNMAWMAAVTSYPEDEFAPEIRCSALKPVEGECCVVVRGAMQFGLLGRYNAGELRQFVQDELNSASLVDGTEYRTAFRAHEFEDQHPAGRDDLPPASNQDEDRTALDSEDDNLTIVGGFVIGGLVAAFIGVLACMFRRRRKFLQSADIEAAVSKSDQDTEGGASREEFLSQVPSVSPSGTSSSVHVNVLSDRAQPVACRQISNITGSYEESTQSSMFDTADSFEANEQSSAYKKSSYTFDLGASFKNEVMGAYGGNQPTSIPVVPPYPMEETSDSEADSWAQTDGTVGSLEDRLEEITAEI